MSHQMFSSSFEQIHLPSSEEERWRSNRQCASRALCGAVPPGLTWLPQLGSWMVPASPAVTEQPAPCPLPVLELSPRPESQPHPSWPDPLSSGLVSRVVTQDRMGCQVEYISVRLEEQAEAPISPGGTSSLPHCSLPALCPSSSPSDHPCLLPSLHHSEGQALARESWTSVLPILSQGFRG